MDPTLTGKVLGRYAHCNPDYANNIKRQYAQTHELIIENYKEKGAKIKKIIFNALEENPNLTISELAKLADCSEGAAQRIRKQYAEVYGGLTESPQEIGEKNREIIFAALDKNPRFSGQALAELADCSEGTVSNIKRHWQELYGKPQESPNKEETILLVLKENPNLTLKEVAQAANCSVARVAQIKRKHQKSHGKSVSPYKETIFKLLEENPKLPAYKLALLINCSEPVASKHKQHWLELHGAEPQDEQSAD